jgi:hypothetical protein
MAARAQGMTVEFHAWDATNNAAKTGDGANFTMRWIKDGTSAALTTTTVTEIDSTNAPGVYKVSLSSTETDCLVGKLAGKSSTSGIYIFGPTITFDQLPTAAPGASGGVPTVDSSNAVKVQSGTGANQISLSSGAVIVQSGTGTGQISLSSGRVAVQSNTQKNAAATINFAMTDSTNHNPATGKTVAVSVSIDGSLTFNAATNTPATEVGNGTYKITLTAAEMNGNEITVRATGTGCDDRLIVIITDP